MAQEKLPLNMVLEALDKNDKEVYDMLPDEMKKQVNFWLLNRYMSNVKGNRVKQELAVQKVNAFYNKNWNVLGTKHPKLQWQLLCISGNTKQKEFHQWMGLKQKKNSNSKAVKLLNEIYPNMKQDEVELLARISTKAEIKALATEHGYEKVDI